MPYEGQTAPPWWSYLWDCCVGVYGTFRTIPTVESYRAGVFVPARILTAVKLLISCRIFVRCQRLITRNVADGFLLFSLADTFKRSSLHR